MKKLETGQIKSMILVFLVLLFFSCSESGENKWKIKRQSGYSMVYTSSDEQNINTYLAYVEHGKKTVEDFFQSTFNSEFNIQVHPNRISLDSAWQRDWKMPEFKSECWMVASGVSDKLDMISPIRWDSISCEHSYSDTLEVQKLITHELVHVYHGQQNLSPDFSDVSGIDWFVEGIAVYASGQCDSIRISDVKKEIIMNKHPKLLEEFWTGQGRYGFSGTFVMYLDTKFGKEKLQSLLKFNNKEQLLSSINTGESELIDGWLDFMENL